MNNEDKTTS